MIDILLKNPLILVVPSFWSVWLSAHSGFPVGPAFLSFQISCRSGHSPAVPVTTDKINSKVLTPKHPQNDPEITLYKVAHFGY